MGGYPNGLSFDPSRNHLLAANVPRQDDPAPITVSIVDTKKKILEADITVPGRTRWTVFDPKTDRFYVNISKPSQIIAVNSRDPDGIEHSYNLPAVGPHGMDIDLVGRRLFCACDQGGLYTVDLESGFVSKASDLKGTPDVIFYNPLQQHLYVAIGDPGLIEVFATQSLKAIQAVKTQLGAHTIAYDPGADKVYCFNPETHRAAVYKDT